MEKPIKCIKLLNDNQKAHFQIIIDAERIVVCVSASQEN